LLGTSAHTPTGNWLCLINRDIPAFIGNQKHNSREDGAVIGP